MKQNELRERLTEFAMSLEGTYLDFPFGEEMGVFKHGGNGKWFGVFIEHGEEDYLNLKCDPILAQILREQFAGVIAGYHMNKTHWNSVILGKVEPEQVEKMISHSYEMTRPKRAKPAKK